MKIIKLIIQFFLDSIFPFSKEDNLLFSYSKEQAFSQLTKAGKTPIKETQSVFSYKNKLVTRLIWNIKYKKLPKAIEIGGYALFKQLEIFLSSKNFPKIILIPIPITSKRRKERGFNQCELLVKEIKRLDYDNRFSVETRLLERRVHRDRQTLKNRSDRLIDSKGVFVVNEKILDQFEAMLNDSKKENYVSSGKENSVLIFVIDDVITTGSTIKEAIEILKKTGLKNVYGLSLAH